MSGHLSLLGITVESSIVCCTGRGRGGSDGGYYHRSFSFDEQTSGGNTDHFNRSPMDGSSNRGGYEYGRGRGGGGARLGWNNSWRDGTHNSEDERWNSGANTRWSLSSPGKNSALSSDLLPLSKPYCSRSMFDTML